MKQATFIIALLFTFFSAQSQTSCVQHWSKNKTVFTDLDSILASIDKQQFDSFYCDSFTMHTKLNAKWYTNFYNKHIGNYFSDPTAIAFYAFYFKSKEDRCNYEMNIIQFVLDEKQVKRFINKYGTISKKKSSFTIEAFTAYKYIVKKNAIYFICTLSHSLAHQEHSFFDDVVETISKR